MTNQRKQSNPIGQHYTPVFYLNKFTDDQGIAWVCNKKEKTIKPISPRVIGLEKNIYTFEKDGIKDFSIEGFLRDEIDGPTKTVINKIENKEYLTKSDRQHLSKFIGPEFNSEVHHLDG